MTTDDVIGISGASFDEEPQPRHVAILLVAIAVVVLLLLGFLFSTLAFDVAGVLASLLVVAVTVLWLGDEL